MKIGAFEVREPIPELKDPHVLAILRPWIDVNNVGTLTLDALEVQLGAKGLAQLARPGIFFDFTRYRPLIYHEGAARRLKIPNTTLSYAQRTRGNDLLFLRLLEPHCAAEDYVDSVIELFRILQVKRYCLLGSMYDAVPHTKPLIVNGRASGLSAEQDLKRMGVRPSQYQGPTSITYLITMRAAEVGMETLSFIVSLPQYVNLDDDYLGKVRLLEILNLLYDLPIPAEDFEKAARQRSLIDRRVKDSPELLKVIPHLETLYGHRTAQTEVEGMPGFSSKMEELFWETDEKNIGKA